MGISFPVSYTDLFVLLLPLFSDELEFCILIFNIFLVSYVLSRVISWYSLSESHDILFVLLGPWYSIGLQCNTVTIGATGFIVALYFTNSFYDVAISLWYLTCLIRYYLSRVFSSSWYTLLLLFSKNRTAITCLCTSSWPPFYPWILVIITALV